MFYEKHYVSERKECDLFLGTHNIGTTTLLKE
jgi:hypothetical protein